MNLKMIFTKERITIIAPVTLPTGEVWHEEKMSYDELPVNGMKLTVTSIDKEIDNEGNLSKLIFEVSSFEPQKKISKGGKKIRCKVTATSRKYGFIRFSKSDRRFFPGYKEPFTLIAPNGEEIKTWVAGGRGHSEIGDPDDGNYLSKGMTHLFDLLPDVEPGNEFEIEMIEPYKRYRLNLI